MRKLVFSSAALILLIGFAVLGVRSSAQAQEQVDQAKLVELGKLIFFDPNLSVNRTQSCADCHGPEVGFTGPDSLQNDTTAVYHGAIAQRYGNRKPPAAAYAGDSPNLYFDEGLDLWFGGMFWDGRATGWTLGDPLAEQAQGPFLNPLEMAIPEAQLVVNRVAKSAYAGLFREVWGKGSLSTKNIESTYELIARSISAYEQSAEVNPFNSKFDLFWDNATAAGKDVTKIRCGTQVGGGMGGGGMGGGGMCSRYDANGTTSPYSWWNYRGLGLTNMELQGLAVFNDPKEANCALCHTLTPGEEGYPLFTDFSYRNIGVPKNPANPFYKMDPEWNPAGVDWVDLGLGGFLESIGEPYESELGKMKVPTLRNVDLRPSDDFVKSYTHNGAFKSLQELIVFYSWRGLVMNGGLGMGGSGTDGCLTGDMGGGGMGPGGGMGGGGMLIGGIDPANMCDPDLFPVPEVDQNITPMNHFNIMSDTMRIEAFLKTLSDGYFSRP